MTETILILIRHGETEWNLQGRWQGHHDSPLTDNGRHQAQIMADSLKQIRFSALYSSDLGRAMETAGYISKVTGKSVGFDPRLRERSLGVFEGLTTEQIKLQYPDEYNDIIKSDADYAPPEAESIRQRSSRNVDCFIELAERHCGESIIIVCHGGVIDSLFRHVVRVSLEGPRRYKIWNTGKNTFSYEQGTWQLLTFGDISHLENIKTLDDL
jgi:2,3-bisphosphoglycerate-dependent phosphoglycerate mutase